MFKLSRVSQSVGVAHSVKMLFQVSHVLSKKDVQPYRTISVDDSGIIWGDLWLLVSNTINKIMNLDAKYHIV